MDGVGPQLTRRPRSHKHCARLVHQRAVRSLDHAVVLRCVGQSLLGVDTLLRPEFGELGVDELAATVRVKLLGPFSGLV